MTRYIEILLASFFCRDPPFFSVAYCGDGCSSRPLFGELLIPSRGPLKQRPSSSQFLRFSTTESERHTHRETDRQTDRQTDKHAPNNAQTHENGLPSADLSSFDQLPTSPRMSGSRLNLHPFIHSVPVGMNLPTRPNLSHPSLQSCCCCCFSRPSLPPLTAQSMV